MCNLQHLRDDGSAGDFDENDMVEPNTVEGVQERQATLNLMRLDHSLQDLLNGHGFALARKVVCDCEDGSQVVGRMTPYQTSL